MAFATAREVTRHTAELIRPRRRVRPSEAARKLRTEKGAWDPALAPMMAEPLDLLATRQYTGIVYVGPARTSKTMSLLLGGITYIVTCAPGDTLVVQMSKDTARDFSLTDLDRAIRHSDELRDALSPRARDDNTFDKFFRSGMVLKLGWPAATQLSGKTIRYVLITDYDRPENRDNVDGEGMLWDVALKRIETMMSRGKCLAESSPDAEYLDPKWKPGTAHEAPPARGILELYNRGTRARLYWPCWHCREFFEAAPGLKCFALPSLRELEERVRIENEMALAARYARVACPHCGGLHEQHQRPQLNARSRWVHEGERITVDGEILGERRQSQIASFWQGGVSAAFQSWEGLLLKYLQALNTYLRTGEEQSLKFTVNTDQGAAYLPRIATNRRTTDELRKRLEDWPKGAVPPGVRFLIASVDVQGNRFIVHVYGWGVGLESWLIDRFVISASRRPEHDGMAALDPAAYLEDWDALLERVIEKRYPVMGTEFALPMRLVMCDSGGKSGVTAKAYAYYRWLRKRRKHFRFRLIKGSSRMEAATATLTWPDASDRKDRKQGGRGDVPVWLINTTVLKDAVVGDLARTAEGAGFVHLPKWLLEKDEEFFAELSAEQRTEKGWRNPSGARNEALDLHVYARAGCKVLKADRINWLSPPSWAQTIDVQTSAAAARAALLGVPPAAPGGDAPNPEPPPAPPPRRSRPARRPGANWTKGWKW